MSGSCLDPSTVCRLPFQCTAATTIHSNLILFNLHMKCAMSSRVHIPRGKSNDMAAKIWTVRSCMSRGLDLLLLPPLSTSRTMVGVPYSSCDCYCDCYCDCDWESLQFPQLVSQKPWPKHCVNLQNNFQLPRLFSPQPPTTLPPRTPEGPEATNCH